MLFRSSTSSFLPPSILGQPQVYSYAATGATVNCTGNFTNYVCGQLNLLKQSNTVPPNGASLSDEEHYIAATFMYRQLAINDSMLKSNDDLTTFYDNLKNTSIGKFKDIEDVIGSINPEEASTLLSGLNTSTFNRAEQSYYDFYTLFLKYTIDATSFSNDDLQFLQSIGNRCPAVDGPAVFQARALMQTILGHSLPFKSSCGDNYGARTFNQNTNENEIIPLAASISEDVIVFPNPAENQITIQTRNEFTFSEVEFYDLTHRLCHKITLDHLVTSQQIPLDLISGMYLIKIIGNEKQKVVKFFVGN